MGQNLNILASVVSELRSVKWGLIPRLAKDTGVPESTIKKIRSGEVKDPRISTVEALHSYFSNRNEPKEPSHA